MSGRLIYQGRRMDGKKRFCPLLGLRPKGGAARHPCSIVLDMTAPHTCRAGVSADKSAAAFAWCQAATYFCRRTRSAPECLRHSRGKKFLAGYKGKPAFRGVPRNRNFSRKSCFFCLVAHGKRNRRRFRRRGSACVINSPAGRPRTFASYRSAIFMGHSVWGLSTEDRPADAGILSTNWR